MKPIHEKVPFFSNNSFLLKVEQSPFLDVPWHVHPEYELALINKGSGIRVVGDKVDNLHSGDVFVHFSFQVLFLNHLF